MATRIDDITSADWSPLLGSPGDVVEDQADIEQCIDIILGTRKGSDPHRPLFGCDAWIWLDTPPAIAVPNIVAEVVDALELWEPRIEVMRVLTSITAAAATVAVVWKRKGSTTKFTKEVLIVNAA
jgi:phage baseplate assembly protein W